MGNPTGRALSDPQPTHNTLVINQTIPTIAQYRDTVVNCADDDNEPNNALESSSAISASMIGDAVEDQQICSGDSDWFAIPTLANHTPEIVIEFTHANGNLDLAIYDAMGSELSTSSSADDDELVTLAPPDQDTTYYVKVFSPSNHTNSYRLIAYQQPDPDAIYSYWLDNGYSFCGTQSTSILGLICYLNNNDSCAGLCP